MKTHLRDISPALQACLKQIPFIEVALIRPNPDLPGLSASLLVRGSPFMLLVRFQSSGQPRLARLAVYELKAAMSEMTDTYGVFSAPYISPQAAAICRDAGIGYFDLAGNCYLSFGGVYIHKVGSANPFGEKRDLRSLYSPKAERILRVLLTAPRQSWKTQELAQAAQVSLGQVANVKKLLADREWLKTDPAGMSLSNPSALLDEWAQRYDFRRNQIKEFYTLAGVAEAEALFSEACEQLGFSYALTGFSAANRIAPMVRYQRISAFINGEIEPIVTSLGWKHVSSGANISLLMPYDNGVFHDAKNVGGSQIVGLVQTYLDLQNSRGRGQEAADAIRKELEKSW
ncbi:MAG: type IV toxin-antitoxin system AbiEi family antitoxin [Chloroflexi bacterium]|nr:type IV toxin-antitoxin system AbiEi family antitoxin [Chloroflexota bacterium]